MNICKKVSWPCGKFVNPVWLNSSWNSACFSRVLHKNPFELPNISQLLLQMVIACDIFRFCTSSIYLLTHPLQLSSKYRAWEMRTISLTTDCKSRQQVRIGSFSQISWCRPSEPWRKCTRDTWAVAEKNEKLDVGSLTVAKCNDAFTAGLDDDNWNTRSTWCFCKQIIWPF